MLKLLSLFILLASFSIDASAPVIGAGASAPNSPSSSDSLVNAFYGIRELGVYNKFKNDHGKTCAAEFLNKNSANGTLAFRVVHSVNKTNRAARLSLFKELLQDGADVTLGNSKGTIKEILNSDKNLFADFIEAVQRQEMIDCARLSVDSSVASQDSVNATAQSAASNSTKNSSSASSNSDDEKANSDNESVDPKTPAKPATPRDPVAAANPNPADKTQQAGSDSDDEKESAEDATANPQAPAADVAPVTPAPDISSKVDQGSADDAEKPEAASQTPAKSQPAPTVNEDDTLKKPTPSFFSKKNLLIGGTIAAIASYILYANNAKAKKNSAPAAA